MGQMIQKPETNPVLVALLNFFLFGAVGYLVIGQQKKAILSAVITCILAVVTCGTLSWLWPAVVAYDGYLIGQKLQSGQSVGENENSVPFLNNIFKD